MARGHKVQETETEAAPIEAPAPQAPQEGEEQAPVAAAPVTVTYTGPADEAIVAPGLVLRRGIPAPVPADVAEHLRGGRAARYFTIS